MYCVPVCVKMVLDYAIKELKNRQKKISVKTIAKTLGTRPLTGTAPGSIELINSSLGASKPLINFKSKLAGTFNDIKTEIDNKRSVIAWINLTDDELTPVWHTVVINGYDIDKRLIYYIDPLLTKENCEVPIETGYFIQKKLGSRGHLIKLVVVSEAQKTLIGVLQPIQKREGIK